MSRSGKQHRSPLAIALALTAALLLGWQAWTAALNGLSDLYARPAIDYLEQKRFDDYLLTREEWDAIEVTVARANELMPNNPQYLESLGWLYQLKMSLFTDELSIEQLDADARAAMGFFEKASATRPTWPYYWGNLALEQYRRGNYATEEYNLALANAARFGPWKPDTQRLVADLGSDTWEYLTPEAKREFLLGIERGLLGQPQTIVQIVNTYRAWIKVCDAGQSMTDVDLPRLRSLCARHQASLENKPD